MELNGNQRTNHPRLLRLPEVEHLTGFRKSHLYAAIKAGAFPAPVKIGRASAFIEAEILAWIRARIAERGDAAPERLLVTEDELAQALGVSVSFLQKDRLADTPRLPFVRLGSACRYDLEEAQRAVKGLARGGRQAQTAEATA